MDGLERYSNEGYDVWRVYRPQPRWQQSDRQELRVLKDGDIDAMVSTFVKMRQEEYILQLKCVLKSLKHYLGDEMTLEKITIKEEYEGDFIGSQMMDGDMEFSLELSEAMRYC